MTYRTVREQLAQQRRSDQATDARQRLQRVRDELAKKVRKAEFGRLERVESRK